MAVPDTTTYPGVDYYQIAMGQYAQLLHPALPKATSLWGYADVTGGKAANFRHLGPIIVAQRGRPVRVTYINNLPSRHLLPVDVSSFFPDAAKAQNRAAVHLHGGFVPWTSDGTPFTWFAPDGTVGPSKVKWLPDGVGNLTYDAWYPNLQSARLMWYHDHNHDTTRLNAYAGLASAYVMRDYAIEQAANLPIIEKGGREIPLVIQDKIFVPSNIAAIDPTWGSVSPGLPGDLWYAHVYQHDRWTVGGNAGTNLPMPDPSCIPEFFADTMLMNGTVYPTVQVEPRLYRFRLLNACNARFVNLNLYLKDNSADGITINNKGAVTNAAGPQMIQIGTEGGFLPSPVTLTSPVPFNPATFNGNLVLAPAERADLLIDFGALTPGTKVILYNDSPAPFPGGKPYNDYYPGAPQNPVVTQPGYGPDTRQLLQFEVVAAAAGSPPSNVINYSALQPDPGLLAPLGVTVPPPGYTPVDLTLNEDFDQWGRLTQRLGTNVQLYPKTFGRFYLDAPTEIPKAGSIQVWRLFNTTADTHPIHFHLVNVQVISRQPFQVKSYNGVPSFTGPARGPDPNETGWKETVRMNPGECTTIITKFDLPPAPVVAVNGVPTTVTVPFSPRLQALPIPITGYEYVWHCHILEHEEHDMMRPLAVIP